MSSLLLCQTILCLVAPAIVPIIEQQNSVGDSRAELSSKNEIVPATNILNHLIDVNPFIRFSHTDINGNIVMDGSGYTQYHVNNLYRPIAVVGNRRPKPGNPHKRPLPLKIFGEGTEYRFGPILEFIVQRIQTQFSNYIHEDLSRPSLNSPTVELEPVIESNSVVPPNEALPTRLHPIEVTSQESTIIPTTEEIDEYEGSGAWLTINK